MTSDEDVRLERATRPPPATAPATAPARADPHATEDDGGGMTIEQRYELEKTLAGLELESEQIGVPIGTDERFVLRTLLGRGSMGTVYLAEDVELERRVAIKVVSRRLERGRLELRLRREARALAALDHPNVVKIFDIGKEQGEPFIAMEHVAGHTLREWQRGRGLPQLLDAYLQAGRGLAAAHAHGLVHRDFKPDNALVDEHEGRLRVRVGDFGLAGDEPEDPATVVPTGDGTRTEHRGLLGTLVYMAPEQLRRERADARSDQHQFCVALWEAVAGSRPFEAERPLEGSSPVPPCPPTMPRWLHRVLRRGLSFAAEDRYPSMDALLAALERGRLVQRSGPWLAAIGLVAAVPFAAFGLLRTDPCAAVTAPMAAVWNDEAKADIEAAFGPRDAGGDERTTEYLVDRLDRAAAQWSSRAVEVCETRMSTPAAEQPALERSAECIDRWVERMASRVAWLRHPEAARMEHAYELVAPLTLTEGSCELPPIMIDREVEAAIEAAEQAELLRDLDRALALASAAVELAATRGTPCAVDGPNGELRSSELAAASFRLGHVLAERSEPEPALAALTRAHEHANACRDDHREAEARVHAAKVLAADRHDLAAADLALDDAWIALRHADEPAVSLRRYEERTAATLVAMLRRDHDAARSYAEAARAALGDPAQEPLLAAKLELNIGVLDQLAGRDAEAAAAYGRATALMAGVLGPEHPQTRLYAAREALNVGLAARRSADYPRMREALATAAASTEPAVAIKALTAWAQGELDAGDSKAASARAAALVERLGDRPDLPPVTLATAEMTAGQLLLALGEPGGIEALARACARWHELGTPAPIVTCEVSLGLALHDAGRKSEARQALGRMRGLPVDPASPLPAAIADLEALLRADPSAAVPDP